MKVHEIQSDLWLTKIDYSGDNIGNEFEFDISRGSNDKSVVKIRLQNGQINSVDKLLFTLFFDKEQSISVNVIVTGQLSSGCITVLQNNPEHIWSKVYERLIYCRKKGQKGIVGTVEVVHEER